MKGRALLFVESVHPQVAHVVVRLVMRVGGRLSARIGSPDPNDASLWVAIGMGSYVRPCLSVRFSRGYAERAVEEALPLALSEIAWRGADDFEPWRAMSSPLPKPLAGTPDPDRSWVLLGQDATAEETDAQIHRLAPSAVGRLAGRDDEVLWPATPEVSAALLGRVEATRGIRRELAWDAARAGVRSDVRAFASPDSDDGQRLAGVIPPAHPAAVSAWIADVLDGTNAVSPPLLVRDWRPVYEGPRSWRPAWVKPYVDTADRTRRKWRKLVRDPRRFVGDSRLASLIRSSNGFGQMKQ